MDARRPSFRPRLEILEDRAVPALFSSFLTGDPASVHHTTAFVAEGRIGSSAYPGQNFTFEADVHKTTAGPFGPGQTADLHWLTGGEANPFTLTYTPGTNGGPGTATWTNNGKTVTYANVSWPDTAKDALLLRVASYQPGVSLRLANLTLTVASGSPEAIPDPTSGDPVEVEAAGASGKSLLLVNGVDLQAGFTLTGQSYWVYGHQAAKQSQLAFQIKVGEWNSPPVAMPDAYRTFANTPLTVGDFGVFGNDVSVDGDALTALLVGQAQHGTVALQTDGTFTYTPHTGFVGEDSFTYRASDGLAQSELTTVTVTVSAGTFRFSQDVYQTAEGDSFAVITVERTGLTDRASSVHYATRDGDALGAADGSGDYLPASGVLEFDVGEIAKTISVAITDDDLPENYESLGLTLDTPSAGYLLDEAAASALLVIQNNDGAQAVDKPFGGALKAFGTNLKKEVVEGTRELLRVDGLVEDLKFTFKKESEDLQAKLDRVAKLLKAGKYAFKEALAGDIFDKSVFNTFENLQAGDDKILITINGIKNTEADAQALLNSIKSFNVGNNKVAVVNGTHGLGVQDLASSIIKELGVETVADIRAATQIQLAYEALKRNGVANPTIYVVAHSQGTAIVMTALDFLSPEVKSSIEFYGNGGQQFVPKDIGLKKAVNYMRQNDYVALLMNFNLIRHLTYSKDHQYDVINIGLGGLLGNEGKLGAHAFDRNYKMIYERQGELRPPKTDKVDYPSLVFPGFQPLMPNIFKR
ncbi:MAG: cadherin-like domain-containing protein [Planctomycetia bacterium]|nr:cadherin-like domain-containing protein [Planctomycetia bacterium]